MGQHPSFVHLRYFSAPDPDARPGISILVACAVSTVEVIVRPDWKRHIDSKDHEYVALMLEDWRQTSDEAAVGLMEALAEMSLGPLRAVESGRFTPEKRSVLVTQVFAGKD